MSKNHLSRRGFIAALPALSLAPGAVLAEVGRSQDEPVNRIISSFRKQDWRDHFDDLGEASIVADTVSRALHF